MHGHSLAVWKVDLDASVIQNSESREFLTYLSEYAFATVLPSDHAALTVRNVRNRYVCISYSLAAVLKYLLERAVKSR